LSNFRFIAANDHPDHNTVATFRQVLELAREMGMLKMGTVALGGTKIHANASRHSALSYEHAGKIEAQLKAEVAELLARAEAANGVASAHPARKETLWFAQAEPHVLSAGTCRGAIKVTASPA
jgi:hypothetical protein